MKFISADNIEYRVESLGELVSMMHDDSYAHADSDDQFMTEMAGRIKFTTDSEIRSNSVENFVADLLTIGYLKEVRDEEDEEEVKSKH